MQPRAKRRARVHEWFVHAPQRASGIGFAGPAGQPIQFPKEGHPVGAKTQRAGEQIIVGVRRTEKIEWQHADSVEALLDRIVHAAVRRRIVRKFDSQTTAGKQRTPQAVLPGPQTLYRSVGGTTVLDMHTHLERPGLKEQTGQGLINILGKIEDGRYDAETWYWGVVRQTCE